MLTIKILREQKEEVIKRLKIKNFDAKELVEKILQIDNEKRYSDPPR